MLAWGIGGLRGSATSGLMVKPPVEPLTPSTAIQYLAAVAAAFVNSTYSRKPAGRAFAKATGAKLLTAGPVYTATSESKLSYGGGTGLTVTLAEQPPQTSRRYHKEFWAKSPA